MDSLPIDGSNTPLFSVGIDGTGKIHKLVLGYPVEVFEHEGHSSVAFEADFVALYESPVHGVERACIVTNFFVDVISAMLAVVAHSVNVLAA